jgi:hypothetical protein
MQRGCAFYEDIAMPSEKIYDGKEIPAKTLAIIEPFLIGSRNSLHDFEPLIDLVSALKVTIDSYGQRHISARQVNRRV